MEERNIVCRSCGKELEHKMGRMPCEDLRGWLTISHWKGRESVDHFSFCSVGCMQAWVEDQRTPIPEVFLKSFAEWEHDD